VNIPRDQLAGSLDILPTDRSIVTYCNMHNPGNSGSEYAADLLRDAGRHARALEGGYPAWEEAGYPIDKERHELPQSWQRA
jgi:rhodanese-related sulfurtransferase